MTDQTEARMISDDDYLKLLGLMTLAREHVAMVNRLEKAMMDLVGDDEMAGHVSDSLWGSIYDTAADAVAEILRGLNLTVAAETPKEAS